MESNKIYALDVPCMINGDLYTRVEVAPSGLKHYEEYFTAIGLTGFEAAAEKAIRYIAASLCGRTLVPVDEPKVSEQSYEILSFEKDGAVKENRAKAKPERAYGTSSQALLAIPGIPAIQSNRESRFHLRPNERTIFFYHLLEMRKAKWTLM